MTVGFEASIIKKSNYVFQISGIGITIPNDGMIQDDPRADRHRECGRCDAACNIRKLSLRPINRGHRLEHSGVPTGIATPIADSP